MTRLRRYLALALYLALTAFGVFALFMGTAKAAGDWSLVRRVAFVEGSFEEEFQLRSDSIFDSEGVDLSRCSSVTVRWDPSVADTSDLARGSLLQCRRQTGALDSADCETVFSRRADTASTGTNWPNNGSWRDNDPTSWAAALGETAPTALISRASGTEFKVSKERPYFRASLTTAPTGGDVWAVQLTCRRDLERTALWKLLQGAYTNRTELSFQHASHTSCNSARCTPNDALTPTWDTSAIGGSTTYTWAQVAAAVGFTGAGVLDPGTAANQGGIVSLPDSQALTLETANRLRFPGKAPYLRVAAFRSGATAVTFIGLCTKAPGGALDAPLTTAGAAAGGGFGFIWKTDSTVDAVTATTVRATSQALDELQYRMFEIVSDYENISADAVLNLEIDDTPAAVDTALSWKLVLDGQKFYGLSDDVGGAPDLGTGTKQLTPCIASVNVGGTADNVTVEDLDWETPKRMSAADTN